MAKSTNQIFNELKEDLKKDSHFANVTDNKSSAFYSLVWNFAKTINSYEQILDEHRRYITNIVKEQKVGQTGWYADLVTNFQKDVALNDEGEYDTIDPAKQIIKYCAVRPDANDYSLTIKIRGANGAITDPKELAQIKSYIDKVIIVGTAYRLISRPADVLKLNGLQVQYDNLLYSDTTALESKIKGVIAEYLKNLQFDSTFYIQEIFNVVENVEGVKNVYINISDVEVNSNVLQSTSYVSNSGWMVLDANSTYELTIF